MTECDDDCMMCSGEACDLCGAGCWSKVKNCEHDVIDRHLNDGDDNERQA